MKPIDRSDCQRLDSQDPLHALRAQFQLPEGVIYLDGNSLGAMPHSAAERVAHAVNQEWAQGLIRSWNDAGWFELPHIVGDKIATLIGASPGTVVATDTTSINLYKVLSAALSIAQQDAPGRRRVVSERSNFPTDLYIAQSLCRERGYQLELIDAEQLQQSLTDDVAVLMLTHVNYRTGAMFDMAGVTARAHAAGALMVWDLAHSAGAVPVALESARADFAVGCGYKYLNGGPGAPAFVWVHPDHTDRFWQPLAGWFGHAAPFAFTPDYTPAPGINRYLCGTQPILSMRALECGVDSVLAARSCVAGQNAMQALRAKSLALTDLFIRLVEQRCSGHGLDLLTPRDHTRRGSQVSLARAEGAYPIMQALIGRGVIGDFRAGDPGAAANDCARADILRFGFTPLYTGYADVWQAVEHLHQVLQSGEWRRDDFNRKNAVT
ncbi:MAG: kynureninase [Burkholderiaceae bacterium]